MSQSQAPSVVQFAHKMNVFMGQEFPPGPRCLPWYFVINFQKGGCLPFCISLMWFFNNWSVQSWFYTAAHGSYGLCWLLKHALFPDPQWSTPITAGGAVMSFVIVLGPYWVAPYLLISGAVEAPSVCRCAVAMIVYVIGLVLMMAADCYKAATLAVKPGLITSGPFALCRHPNYLGEMMIYGGFAAMVPHWAPKVILAYIWILLFLTNISMKEARMSRHAEWKAYCASTPLLVPNLSTLLGGAAASKGD
eukprot:TRINITY_DN74265_c0_g1_i1.p1 TRINITY_DN74265_c0_g1~~TRINITY_DN74265_c0_g1_i1.p1  ORF type:complete len:249 (+),score=37.27 TRINITY_DN74265_c0_g1_i1:66-812(+)